MSRRGSNQLSNAIRQQARMAITDLALPNCYLISSYDGKGNVKVTIEPGTESNWMPLGGIGVGSGWGVAVGPQIGDQVMVVFEHGDVNSGVVTARIHSVQAPAMAVPSGETWIVHQSTTSIKLVTNGDLDITTAGNLNATVAGNMSANVTGNASIASAAMAAITAPVIQLGATGQSLLKLVTSAMVSFFNAHTHTSTTPGTPTSTPNQTMGSGQLTSTISGG